MHIFFCEKKYFISWSTKAPTWIWFLASLNGLLIQSVSCSFFSHVSFLVTLQARRAPSALNEVWFLLGLSPESEQPRVFTGRSMVLLVSRASLRTTPVRKPASWTRRWRKGSPSLLYSDGYCNAFQHPLFSPLPSFHPWGPSFAVWGVEICWLFLHHPLLNTFFISHFLHCGFNVFTSSGGLKIWGSEAACMFICVLCVVRVSRCKTKMRQKCVCRASLWAESKLCCIILLGGKAKILVFVLPQEKIFF